MLVNTVSDSCQLTPESVDWQTLAKLNVKPHVLLKGRDRSWGKHATKQSKQVDTWYVNILSLSNIFYISSPYLKQLFFFDLGAINN